MLDFKKNIWKDWAPNNAKHHETQRLWRKMVSLDGTYFLLCYFIIPNQWCSWEGFSLQKRDKAGRPPPSFFSFWQQLSFRMWLIMPELMDIWLCQSLYNIVRTFQSSNMLMIPWWLHDFSTSTCLKVNFSKSVLVPINLEEDRTTLLAQLCGCVVGTLPFTYLGLPLGPTKPK